MISSTAVAVPSFTGLRAASCSPKAKVSAAPSPKLPTPIKASFKVDMGVVVAATAASAMLVGNGVIAMEEVLSHNVALEEDHGAGVEVGKKSMRGEEGYQKGAGEGRYSMWVDENFDCTAPPHGPPMDDAKQMQRKLLARLMMPW